jgi:hypothetical protein
MTSLRAYMFVTLWLAMILAGLLAFAYLTH